MIKLDLKRLTALIGESVALASIADFDDSLTIAPERAPLQARLVDKQGAYS